MNKLPIFLITFLVVLAGYFAFKLYYPLGQPELDQPAEETMIVLAFFSNSGKNPVALDCGKVFPVKREIVKTQTVVEAALNELLKGPTEEEKTQGYFTSINSGVKIQTLSMIDGVVTVNFDEQLEFQVGGSCRVAAIRVQITDTLMQFPTVNSVIISIDDRTEDILQP